MGSVGNPKVWVPLPYMNNKDCSQGFCTLYCPQWCYIIFPPPPPPFGLVAQSGPTISPVVAAIIGILVSALLLVGYYTIISKYCGNSNSSSGRGSQVDPDEDFGENDDSPRNGHGPWHNIPTAGLEEAMIKSIAVCRYERGDGLVQGTDCSVCLGEFRGGETLRLLPKCSHAFHVLCIDTWLKSHSNCPLCRAIVVGPNALQSPAPLVIENRQSNEPSSEREERNENVGESGVITQTNTVIVTKTQSDSGNSDYVGIEIRDGDVDAGRSASMDHLRLPVAGVLRLYG